MFFWKIDEETIRCLINKEEIGSMGYKIEELEEAGALESISHMPARVKCALLGWRTIGEMLGKSS